MSPIDIVIVVVVLIGIFFGVKRVRSSIKQGGCAGCSKCSECEKNNAELQKGYEEWLKKKNEKKEAN